MITYNGGSCQQKLDEKCTHLITMATDGVGFKTLTVIIHKHKHFILQVLQNIIVSKVQLAFTVSYMGLEF